MSTNVPIRIAVAISVGMPIAPGDARVPAETKEVAGRDKPSVEACSMDVDTFQDCLGSFQEQRRPPDDIRV